MTSLGLACFIIKVRAMSYPREALLVFCVPMAAGSPQLHLRTILMSSVQHSLIATQHTPSLPSSQINLVRSTSFQPLRTCWLHASSPPSFQLLVTNSAHLLGESQPNPRGPTSLSAQELKCGLCTFWKLSKGTIMID